MVGLTGRKLAWCNVGDASIQLFRPAPGEGRLRCVFSTVEQRSTVRTASGQEIQMPLQLGCYSHADQTVEHAVKSMEGANFGIMTPEVGDIILVCSDGVTDNLGGNLLVRSLEAHPSGAALPLLRRATMSRGRTSCARGLNDGIG